MAARVWLSLLIGLGALFSNQGLAATLFEDDFSGTLATWSVQQGSWSITNSAVQGTGTNDSYTILYRSTNWMDYSVSARVQFSSLNGLGGGIGGHLNPTNGAHYAAWVYPEGSIAGGGVLRLIKFSGWGQWSGNPMGVATLPLVGTNLHTLSLSFTTNRIVVSYDGSEVLNVLDVGYENTPAYSKGGIVAEMFTDAANPYALNFDDMDVEGKPLLLLAANNATRVFGSTNPVFTGSFSGLQSGDNITPVFTTTADTNSPAGVYPIVAGFNDPAGALSNYIVLTTNATLTVTATADGIVYADDFTRASSGALYPWTVQAVSWGMTNGLLQGSGSPNNYSYAYVSGGWSNYSVQAQVRFSSSNAWGGGIGGRLNPVTGGHYGAWLYPEGSPGAGMELKLIKFEGWTTWSGTPMAIVPLAEVGTNAHTLRMDFLTNRITVYVDGVLATNVNDNSFDGVAAYVSGGISADMYTDPSQAYMLSLDNVSLKLNRPALSITAASYSRSYGDTNPALGGTILGVQNGDNITVAYQTAADTNSPVGSYAIVPVVSDPDGKLGNYNLSSSNGVLSVTPAALIGTADNKSRAYGATNPPLTVTYSGFVNGETTAIVTGTLLTSTTADTNSPVGNYAIVASGQTAPNYNISYGNGTLSVTPAGVVVQAENKSRAYGQANPALTPTITGLVNGEDTNVLSGNLLLSTTAETNSPIGDYPIEASGLSSTNYSITYSNGSLSVTPYALTVAADNKSRVYGSANPPLTGTVAGVQNGDNIIAGYSASADTNSPVGSYNIVPNLIDPAGKLTNYSVAMTNGTLTVAAAGLLVRAEDKTRVYGEANPPLTAKISGFVNGENTNVLGGSLVLSTSADTRSNVGTYAIQASGFTSTNYSIAFLTGSLTVTAASLAVVADNKSKVYGDANPTLSGTLNGLVSEDGITANFSTTSTTSSPVGSYAIVPTLSDPNGKLTNYNVSSTNGILSVTVAALIGTADSKSRAYGATNPPLTVTYSGFVNGETAAIVTGTLLTSTAADTNSPVGNYTIIASGQTAPNYNVTYSNGTLTVTPYSLSVVAANQTRSFGAVNPALTGTLRGVQNGDNITASYSTSAATNSPVGTYSIVPSLNDPAGRLTNYSVLSSNGILSVTPAALIGTADNKRRVYGATNPPLTVTYSGFVNGETTAIVTGALLTSTAADTNSPVGNYAIVASGQTAPNYNVTYSNGTLTVTPYSLSVVAANQTRSYGAVNPALTGTLSGVQNGDNITATYSTSAVTNSPVGTYSTVPTLSDPAGRLTNYSLSSSNGFLSVTPAALIGTADNKSRVYGATNPPLTVTYSGFVNGETAAIVTGTLLTSTTADTNSPVGNYAIVASGQTAPNYNLSYVNGTLSVMPAGVVVQADNKSRAYGQMNPVLTATITGLVNGEDTNVLSGNLLLSTAVETNSAIGTYPIQASGLSSTNYSITYSNGTLTVTPYALSVAAANQARSYGAVNPPLTGTLTGVQNGDNITASYSTSAVTNSPVGTYSIVPSLNDPAGRLTNYSVLSSNGILSVTPAALIGTADNKSRVYGATNPALTVTYSGFVNGETAAIVTGTLLTSTGADTNSPIGNYPIVASGQTALNYNISYVNGTLSVMPAGVVVQAESKSRAYGQTNPPLTATITGLVNGETINILSGSLVLSTSAETNSPIGDYPIEASGLSSTNYSITYSNGTLTVTPYSLSVVAANQTRSYGAANPALTGTLTGVQNGDNITATYSTSAVTNSLVGTYSIVPSLSDPSGKLTNYSLLSSNGLLSVTLAALIGTADNKSRVYGATNPALTVTYSGFVNGETATIVTGMLLTSTAADTNSPVGNYAIVASGQTAPNYNISYVNGLLSVMRAGVVVQADNKSRAYGQMNPALTATITGLVNGEDTNVLSGNLLLSTAAETSSAIGTYPIQASGLSSTNYSLTFSNGSLSVTPYALTVAADNNSRAYGSANPPLTGTVTGVQNGDNITATYSSSAVTNSPVGTYSIAPSLSDPNGKLTNYSILSSNGVLSVTPAALIGTAENKSRVYGATNPPLTVTYSGFVNGEMAAIVTGTLLTSTTADASSPVGSYTIVASGQTAPNYNINYVNGTLSVTPAGVVVQAENKSRAYGQINPALTATITGLVNGETSNVLSGSLVLSTSAETNSRIGDYPIEASGLSSTNYSITYSNGTLTVTPYSLSVVAANQTRSYGAVNPPLTGTLRGVQNGDNITATYSTSAVTNSPVGTYNIVPSLSDPAGRLTNYSLTISNGVLSVTPCALTVTADDQARIYSASNPGLTVHYSGFANGETASVLQGSPTVTTAANASSPVGAYGIFPTIGTLSSSNYTFDFVSGTLTVQVATSATAMGSSANPSVQGANVSFTANVSPVSPATATPTGNVQFYNNGVALGAASSLSNGVASFNTSTLPTGTNMVSAVYLGDGNFSPSTNLVVQVVSAAAQPVALKIQDNGDNTVTVTFHGVPGFKYVVQAADGLVSKDRWVNVSTNTAGAVGLWTYIESKAGHSQRFYRCMQGVQQTVQVIDQPAKLTLTDNQNGTVIVVLSGAPVTRYLLRATTDLGPGAAWSPIYTNTTGADGSWRFTESKAGRTQRFYRAERF